MRNTLWLDFNDKRLSRKFHAQMSDLVADYSEIRVSGSLVWYIDKVLDVCSMGGTAGVQGFTGSAVAPLSTDCPIFTLQGVTCSGL